MPSDFAAILSEFAPAKYGKTLTNVAAFPKGLCITAVKENVILPAKTRLNYSPAYRIAKTFAQVTKILKTDAKKYPEVYIDDITVIGKNSEGSGWNAWRRFYKEAGEMFDAARALERPVSINGHSRPGRTNKGGKFLRGGIDLSMDMTEFFTARVDYAGRGISYEPEDSQPVYPHRWQLWGPPADPNWAVGNRLGLPEVAPANLGEMLRATGLYEPQRAHSWQEKIVNDVFGRIKAQPEERRLILREIKNQLLKKGIHPNIALWTLRDAEDRYLIFAAQAKLLSSYDEDEPTVGLTNPEAEEVPEEEEKEEASDVNDLE